MAKMTRAATELDLVLKEGGKAAEALHQNFHRTQLWEYRTGRRQPKPKGMNLIIKITQGRIDLDAWEQPEACTACGRAG